MSDIDKIDCLFIGISKLCGLICKEQSRFIYPESKKWYKKKTVLNLDGFQGCLYLYANAAFIRPRATLYCMRLSLVYWAFLVGCV